MTEKRFKLGYVCGDFGLVDNDEWIDLHSMSENSIKNAQICINKMNELAEENEELKQDVLRLNHELKLLVKNDGDIPIFVQFNALLKRNDKLKKENKELKDKYNEQSVSYEGLEEQVERLLDFKDKVFNLINAKIKLYSHKPVSAPISQPMSVNFDEDVDRLARLSELELLKEELQE